MKRARAAAAGSLAVLILLLAAAPVSAQRRSDTEVRLPRADLVVESLELPPGTPTGPKTDVTPGEYVRVRATVANRGVFEARRGGLEATLRRLPAPGSVAGGRPFRIGTGSLGRLLRGRRKQVEFFARIPVGTAPGSYRLTVCADYLNQNRESNETNNCRSLRTPLTVGGPGVPARIQAVSAPVNVGETRVAWPITATVTYRNDGAQVSPTIQGATVIDDALGDFLVSDHKCYLVVLLPGGTCTVEVTFMPHAGPPSRSAILRLSVPGVVVDDVILGGTVLPG